MVLYASVLVPVSLAPTLVGLAGRVYFAGVLLLGLAFLALGVQFARAADERRGEAAVPRVDRVSAALWALMLLDH